MRTSYPVFVICHDRLSPLRSLVAWLERTESAEIYLIDNGSTYPPLLEYLDRSPHSVFYLSNLGQRSPWDAGLIDEYANGRRYVVTDFDVVPDSACPFDAIDYLSSLLDRYPQFRKAGLGLRIDDLPPIPRCDAVKLWEQQFWRRMIRPGVYAADIDTTFAIYRESTPFCWGPALRTGAPYLARHLPWYEDPSAEDDEQRYYRLHADRKIASWLGGTDYKEEAAKRKERLHSRLGWRAFRALCLGEGASGFLAAPMRHFSLSVGLDKLYQRALYRLGGLPTDATE